MPGAVAGIAPTFVPAGPFTRWAQNGRKIEKGNYANGNRTDAWTFRSDDGSVAHARPGVYENDVKVGD